jgi:hypothetical protein
MDLERSPPPPPPEGGGGGGGGGASCSICLDPVVAGGRSVARLQCGHEFHLGQILPRSRSRALPGHARFWTGSVGERAGLAQFSRRVV